MRKHDISQHRATSVDNLELHAFDWIVAMDPEVRRRLIDFYAAPELKIKDIFVEDPVYEVTEYKRCATDIKEQLSRLAVHGQ